MFVTSEILQKAGACGSGYEWFKKHYPEGTELKTLILHRHIPKAFLHWGYRYLTPNEEEVMLYHQVLGNENNDTILDCHRTKNSQRVFYSSDINKCKDIHKSQEISESEVVINSSTVENSAQIFLSEFIYSSIKVINSRNINYSTNIIDSTYVVHSKNVYKGNLISYSSEIYKSLNLEDCYLCSDCSNLKHCFGCQGLEDVEYYIFNKSVGKEHFEIIKKQYLSFIDCLLKYVDNWPVDIISTEIPRIDRKFPRHYQTLPSKFWKWVKTLPNYSDEAMFNLTCLPEFLTK
jgi:hypothetical protein